MSYLKKAKAWEARKKAQEGKIPAEYFDRRLKEMLQSLSAFEVGDDYLKHDEPENQATISRAERKLGAAWARGFAGDESARTDFDAALEELKHAFMKSINDYKRF